MYQILKRTLPLLTALVAVLAVAGPARAAKTYNDPWLEGDLRQMRVPDALDILARTPQHVIVGDVDSGARLIDPDLAPHLLRMSKPYTCADEYGPGPSYAADPANGDFGCDWIGSGNESTPSTVPDGNPTDPFGHGTGTAEIIAGVPNNGKEGAGVAPNARVLPVRACYGGNPDCYNEPAADGLKYAVAMGARVINASWPPEGLSADETQFIHTNANVLFVFAIGGTDQNAAPYPLCTAKPTYPNVLCVGLTNPNDSAGTTNAQTTTDVSAPGYAGVPTAAGARGEFGYTSGATAHVTGAAALLRGIAPDLTAAQIASVLVSTSRPVAGYATANRAKGIVDVAAAVRKAQSMDGLVTPAAGQGAPADSPNPFPRSTATPTPKPTRPSLAAVLAKALVPTGKAAKIGAILKAGGYRVKFSAPRAGTAKIAWYYVPRGAHVARKKRKPKPVLVAYGTKKFAKKGKATLKVKLSKKGKAMLKKVKKHHKLKLTAKGTFRAKGSKKTTAKKKAISLKR